MDDRPRHPDETTTRIAAYVAPDDEDVPWIRVMVRQAPALSSLSDPRHELPSESSVSQRSRTSTAK